MINFAINLSLAEIKKPFLLFELSKGCLLALHFVMF